MKASSHGVDVALDVRREGTALHLELRVENGREDAIFVNAHPGDLDMTAVAARDAYVEYVDRSTLRVTLFPPDPLVGDWVAGVLPLSRRLDAGGVHRAVLRIPIPVEPWSPYEEEVGDPSAPAPATVPAEAGRLVFATRWFPEDGLRWSRPGPEHETWWCSGSPTFEVEIETPLEPPVPVVVSPSSDS